MNKTTHQIKKYVNRKLYHVGISRYVTLQEIASFLRAGDDVVVTDHETKADVTIYVLAMIIAEETKAGQKKYPVDAMAKLIRGDAAEPTVSV